MEYKDRVLQNKTNPNNFSQGRDGNILYPHHVSASFSGNAYSQWLFFLFVSQPLPARTVRDLDRIVPATP